MHGLICENQIFHAGDLDRLTGIAERNRRSAVAVCDFGVLEGVVKLNLVMMTAAAYHGVVAGSADHEEVVSISAFKRVASGAGDERIVTIATFDQLSSARTTEQVVVAAAA